ncbi:3-oxoacyl-ACP synthase III family protein [Brenneria rubrifaciens]|uniref:Ketoacyl-ACP synthase III n=1 Tax=Brenneria rubrifaciens TaxID=55213 RepID=A0A4V1F9I3_9GAMM|nr:ketoacyl-ACP synthase III [Brenneria rubrifaciens]QCR07673.1 ketoacyl-ACP synthase III [Brenneria rubrifaciens]
MYTKSISGISVKAITAAIPSTIMGEKDFVELYGEKNTSRVIRGTGIRSIRVAQGLRTSDMISSAIEHLSKNIDFDKSEIDGVIVITQTPDDWSPGTAFSIHQKLELPRHCFLLDLNSGCSGYANGIIQAAALINSNVCKNVMVCTGDINTRLISDKDYQIRMLFGDAATVSLVTKGSDNISFIYGSDGSGRELLGTNLNYEKNDLTSGRIGFLKMDGAAVMSFALKRVPEVINTLLEETQVKKENVDLYALHQPNEFILGYLRDILELDDKKLPADVDGIGNTNSSSIPLLLCRKKWNSRKDNVLICGFGVGLSWNSMLLNLNDTIMIEPMEIIV